MAISADQVKALRDATGAGMMDSKRALEATNGDLEKAKDWLRQKGMARLVPKRPALRERASLPPTSITTTSWASSWS